MTRALLLIGSPRGKKSTSTSVGNYLLTGLKEKGLEINTLWIKRQLVNDEKIAEMLEAIDNAEIVILTAPLYDDCQPYIVIKTMELIVSHQKTLATKRFIPIINCGFLEAHQITTVAIPIYKKFASKVGLEWAGSLAIGGGEILNGKNGIQLDDLGGVVNKVKKALEQITEALANGVSFPDEAMLAFPEIFAGRLLGRYMIWNYNRSKKKEAKMNGAEVDARPYVQ